MSDHSWFRALACLIGGLLLAGCDGAMSCRQCEKRKEPVRVEVNWQELVNALEEAQVGRGDATVTAGTVNVTLAPERPQLGSTTVAVAGWDALVGALQSIQTPAPSSSCTNCPGNNAAQSIHHTTVALRLAPPWFNADQRSLFTSYIFFPEEAKFEEWLKVDPAKSCALKPPPPSVCPETSFYENAMRPFLKGLSQCVTTEPVRLHIVGFTSSTRLNKPESVNALKTRYNNYIEAIAESCEGKAKRCEDTEAEDEGCDPSKMFNLLIANERARHAAAMLKELLKEFASTTKSKNAFAIDVIPWCSYDDMANGREFKDDGDPVKAFVNRRVEVRLKAPSSCLNVDPDIPRWGGYPIRERAPSSCLNVDPDKRIDVTD